jgi:hypothetical protein
MKKSLLFSILCMSIFIFSCKKENSGIAVTGVSLDRNTLELHTTLNNSAILSATVEPATADNKEVRWQSDKTGVADVDDEGNVTGIAAGTAVITVVTADGNFEAKCTVTVTAPDANYHAKQFIGENLANAKETFPFNTSELPKTFMLRNGVKITLPTGISFTKGGNPVTGALTLEAYGMLKPSDMILSGTGTNYKGPNGNGYLVSDGFVFVNVKQNGESVDEDLSYPYGVDISIPTDKTDGATNVWEGEEADEALIWGDLNGELLWGNRNNDWNEVGVTNGSFSFNFGKLGWVNCDVLWRVGASFTTVKVTVTGKTGAWASYQGYSGDTFVFFVGKGYNVIAQLYTQLSATAVQSYDDSMPVDDEGKMIAFSIKEGEFAFASQDVKITANQQITLDLKPISKDDLLAAIKALDPK